MSQRIRQLGVELETIGVTEELTDVFSNIASIKIRSIRQRTLNSKVYFNDLWAIYQQIRVEDELLTADNAPNDKQLILLFTSSRSLSNVNDSHIIDRFVKDYNSATDDVLVIGSNGLQLLHHYNIVPVHAFEVPDVSKPFSTQPIIDVISQYRSAVSYYYVYFSLSVQKVGKLKLLLEPQVLTPEEKILVDSGDSTVITYDNFIFEPTLNEVVATLEQVMLNTTIAQLLFETRLSQFASRFMHMSLAHNRAERMYRQLHYKYLSLRRYERDEAGRQIVLSARTQTA